MTHIQNANRVIHDENGQPQMLLASSLMNYLSGRRQDNPFRFGEWLMSISDEELQAIRGLVYRSIEDNSSNASELLAIYLLGVAAEHGNETGKYSIDLNQAADFTGDIATLVEIEDLRRQGSIFIRKITSIDAFESNEILVSGKEIRRARWC